MSFDGAWCQRKIQNSLLVEEFTILKTTLEELHPDLYRYAGRAKFNAAADSISKLLLHDADPLAFYLTIAPLVSMIRNGHTTIRPPSELCDTMKVFPLRLISFDGRVYVHNDMRAVHSTLPGAEVRKVNEMSVNEIIRRALPYVSVDGNNNIAKVKAAIEDDLAYYFSLIYGGSDEYEIEFITEASGEASVQRMKGISYKEFLSNYDNGLEFPWSLTKVDSSTAMMKIRSFENTALGDGNKFHFHQLIARYFRLIKQWNVSNLIVDLRFNGGGELKNAILLYSYLARGSFQFAKQIEMASIRPPTYSHLTNYQKALKFSPISRKHIVRVSERVFLDSKHFSLTMVHPEKNSFNGRLFILINGNTASAAGAFASCIKNEKRGIIVGDENRDNYTGFSAGVPVILTLPHSGITVSVPIRKFTYANGQDTGRGVTPDHQISSSASEFFGKEDRSFDLVLELLRKNEF